MQKNLDEINLHSGALAKFLKLEANLFIAATNIPKHSKKGKNRQLRESSGDFLTPCYTG